MAGARLKPTVDLGLGASGEGTTSGGSGDAALGLSTTWEIDVWGKLASGAAAAEGGAFCEPARARRGGRYVTGVNA